MSKPSITLNQVPLEWDLDAGEFTFLGISAALFWVNPSLYRLLQPLAEEVGIERFRILVASSSSLGTDEDYHAMVTQLGSTFEEGFLAWGRAVSAAGWGSFELLAMDRSAGTAHVRIRNPWELRMQKQGEFSWGCPFLLGKIIGIFNHALDVPCWAEEKVSTGADGLAVDFLVRPSDLTFAQELERLRRARLEARELELQRRVDQAAAELQQRSVEMDRQQAMMRELVAPIIQIWRGVLVVPLAGELGPEQGERLCINLLDRVVALRAREVILDLTGLLTVDEQIGHQLARIVNASRLVGARCTIVGIAPGMAQMLVAAHVELGHIRSLQTLADALQEVVGLQGRGAR